MHKGYKFTEEQKKRLSEAHKGQVAWNKGVRVSLLPNYKKPLFSIERRQKLSEKMKATNPGQFRVNFAHTDESRMKLSISHTGKKHTEATKLKISEQHRGDNAYQWKKDRTLLVSSEKKHLDGRYREWMRGVKNRDNWRCKISNKDCSGRLEAHHILPWRNHVELRYIINNGITLCAHHHPRKRSDESRLSPYFQVLVNKAI